MSEKENQEVVQDKNLPEVSDGNGFVNLLKQEDIKDLNDPRMETKVINNIVIVIINGREAFSVKGEANFDQFKHIFETQSVTDATEQELDNFQQDIELNPADFQARIDVYQEFYRKQKQESRSKGFWLNTNSAGKEKSAYKITAQEADVQLTTLKNIEQRFHQLSRPNRYENKELIRIEREVSMKQLSKELDEILSKMSQFTEYRNDIVTGNMDTTPPFKMTINSINDARNISNILKKFNKQELKLDQYAADAATQAQYAQTLQSLEAYFEQNLNNPDQFQPYQFSAEQILAIKYFPKLKEAMGNIMPQEQTQTNNKTEQTANGATVGPEGQTTASTEKAPAAPVAYKDAQEAFAKGGIKGITSFFLDKTNMSKEQKDNWAGVGNLALLGGGIFLGWKFLKNSFRLFSSTEREKMKTDGGYGWVFGPIAAIFGANALTGESPLALLNGGKGSEYLGGLFGSKKDGGTSENPTVSEAVDTYTKGFSGVSAIFGNATCGQVAESIEEKNGKMKLKPIFVDQIISAAKGDPSNQEKQQAAQAIQLIGEDDPNGLIHNALVAMDLDYNTLKNSENTEKPFKDRAGKAIVRLSDVISYMGKNEYNKINPDKLSVIQDYIANKDNSNLSLSDLQERHGNLFENTAIAPDEATKSKRKTKVDNLTLADDKKQVLLTTMRSFWMDWPLARDLKQLDIKENGGYIEIGTYGQYTKIDFANMTLVGLEDINKRPIKFESLYQTIKVANLTNRILDLTKNNQNPIKKDPFNVSWFGGDIEYDNTKFWSNPVDRFNHMDNTIVSGGTGGSLNKISTVLEDNKEGYVNYLNKAYNTINKLN